MRLLSNVHVKGKPAVLPGRAIRRQCHYFIYRPHIAVNPAVGNATGCGKKPHATPNIAMRYFMRHLKNSQVASAP